MQYIAVYGSLRPGNYNYERILKAFPGQINQIQDGVIAGYKMFDLGHYPAIIPTGNLEDEIMVDVIECGKAPFVHIDIMEKGAGYLSTTVNLNGRDCLLYYMDAVSLVPYSVVTTGDWNKYLDNIKR